MATELYPGRRLSYAGLTCTVRYIGLVEHTKGSWLGVEWDDPSRGKHNGSHEGVKYFDCQSPSPTAGSFVRPTRPTDEPLSFLDALRKKYASPEENASASPEAAIRISGKTVEEVGFEKIAAQLATLHELRIVLLDGLCVRGVLGWPYPSVEQELWLHGSRRIKEEELKIRELDLSRTLIEEWADVVGICSALRSLKFLKLDGNRFRDLSLPKTGQWTDAFFGVTELSLDKTFLSWDEILFLLPSFPALTTLSLASNNLPAPPRPPPTTHLTNLSLASNAITSFSALSPLANLPNLRTLNLRSNPITSLISPAPLLTLSTLDLTSTALPNPPALNPLLHTAPKLTSLLTTHTPLYATPVAHLQTIARLPSLTSLNHSHISPQERTNAELYYLSTVASLLSATSAEHEPDVLQEHPRYDDLCTIHGAPTINRKTETKITTNEPTPGSLAARLVNLTFYLPSASEDAKPEKEITSTLPRTIGIYALKGIVGRLFALKPMKLRLVWETGEWDPVAGTYDNDISSESDDEGGVDGGASSELGGTEMRSRDGGWDGKGDETGRKAGRWAQREEELVDGTKDVGFWIEGKEARVRAESR